MTEDLVLPGRMANLQKSPDGDPVPWFAAIVDGVPDYGTIRPGGIADALQFKLCWICGTHLGKYAAFLVSPLCAITRTAPNPPSHRDCAQYVAQAPLPSRPAIGLVWVTRRWFMYRDTQGQPLFDMGSPDQTYWYAHGRDATAPELVESIEAAMPELRHRAASGGALAAIELEAQRAAALELVPS